MTYVSGTELRTSIPAGEIAAGGEFEVAVTNPPPAGGASAAIVFPVAGFTVDSSPSTATVSAGQSATYTIQLTPMFSSFDSPVSLSCTGLPRGCAASFSAASVTLGANATTSTLTLTTKSRQGSGVGLLSVPTGLGPPVLGLLLLMMALFPWSFVCRPRPRRLARRWLTAGLLICLVVLISGCGAGGDGDSSSAGTPAGTYPVSVQGVSGSLRVSTTVELVVR